MISGRRFGHLPQGGTRLRSAFSLGLILALIAGLSPLGVAAEPTNFRVYGARTVAERAAVLKRCQEIRDELHTRWNGEVPQIAWQPVCEVVLHFSQSDYLQAVGAGARGTVGSTFIQFHPRETQRIIRRRIDLLAAEHDMLAALPHEMTHVLLADRYQGQQPPPWLDEGVATLADTITKQQRHLRDLQMALSGGNRMSIATMVALDGPIPSRQRASFYGQSVALATILTRLDHPHRIFEFAQAAQEHGAERALKRVYKLDLADLDRRIANLALESDLAIQP